jgi:hypothetical protein
VARTLLFALFAALTFALVGPPYPARSAGEAPGRAEPVAPRPPKTVYLGGALSDEERLVFTSAVAGADPQAVVLFDSPASTPYLSAFLAAFDPERVVPVGSFRDGVDDLRSRLGRPTGPALAWDGGRPRALWAALFPRAERAVVCPAEPRGQLLQAACLAGLLKAPLFITHDRQDEADFRRAVAEWEATEIHAVGAARRACRDLPGVRVVALATERAVADACRRELAKRGPAVTLVVANPEDRYEGRGGMSSLGPWLALRHDAPLLLTNPAGDDVAAVVAAALKHKEFRQADSVLIAANRQAVPMCVRPNPIPGDHDPLIELEPLTPEGTEPFSFAVGRVFHDDASVAALMLARPRLLAEARGPRRALIASNPGGNLPLLETFSRNTAKEFVNAGYETTAMFRGDVSKDDLRRSLPGYDVFLWEGHHGTLVREFKLPDWDEPLPPSFVFLQSCLALSEEKAQPLLRRGAVAVIGSPARTYSASGGACSLAFFDALLYEDRSLGGGLRQAKNFLLAYARLKEKRLGPDAKRTGANLRAAWAFTLWGDPTLRLPRPERPAGALPGVRCEVRGNAITLSLPARAYDKVASNKYQVEMPPNARLAGLIRKEEDDSERPLVPFAFAEVSLPQAPAGRVPELHGKLSSGHYVFTWDGRRRTGYLLVAPHTTAGQELRFHVSWKEPDAEEGTKSNEE